MFLIAGLGNPGQKYAETRHNAGFWFVDELARQGGETFKAVSRLRSNVVRTSIGDEECVLIKPATFMNHSGQAVRAVLDYYRIEVAHMLVAYDELDLPVGCARLKQGGGHGGHNGIRDIFRHVPEHDFLRLRIGIGHPGYKDAVTGYVLSRAPADQEQEIRAAISVSASVIPDVLDNQLARAMKTLHTQTGKT